MQCKGVRIQRSIRVRYGKIARTRPNTTGFVFPDGQRENGDPMAGVATEQVREVAEAESVVE